MDSADQYGRRAAPLGNGFATGHGSAQRPDLPADRSASSSAVARVRMRFDDLRVAAPELQPSGETLHILLERIAREDGQVVTITVDARPRSRGVHS